MLGFHSAGDCAKVCSLVFGKQEDGGGFEFTQEVVDSLVKGTRSYLSGDMSPICPILPNFFFQIWTHLCISDRNKNLLICSPDLTEMLIEALLLDPQHCRQNQEDCVKQHIQMDAVECFAQLVLFHPARDTLQRDPAVLDALRQASVASLTEDARRCAQTALVGLEGTLGHGAGQTQIGLERHQWHIMMSYQWSVQDVVKRVVAELKRRNYVVRY